MSLDLGRPLYASSPFSAGDRVVAAGEAFDWRTYGMTPIEVAPLYATGLLTHTTAAPPAPASPPEVTVPAGAASASAADSRPASAAAIPAERQDHGQHSGPPVGESPRASLDSGVVDAGREPASSAPSQQQGRPNGRRR